MFKNILFLIPFLLFATAKKDTFSKYYNPIFIETGTHTGQGVLLAKRAKFKEIFSIELSPIYYNQCKKKFSSFSNIHLYQGDSSIRLQEILLKIKQPITFWLDAHYSGGTTAKGKTMSPILQELEIIKNHPVKSHTILIDDVRQFGTEAFDFVTKEQIIQKIKEINPLYKISYENGHVKNDILVALIEKKKP